MAFFNDQPDPEVWFRSILGVMKIKQYDLILSVYDFNRVLISLLYFYPKRSIKQISMKQNWSTWKFKSAIFILLYFSISWLDSFKVEANASVPYKTTPIYKHFSVEDGLPCATIETSAAKTSGHSNYHVHRL
ncbi:MAG: hypothetical protein IPN13_11065 [Bacteroidetes bacterium]|nr:hypothetical protein [Bacteroidota bacterium]